MQTTLFEDKKKKQRKPLTELDLLKMLCQYSGRDFSGVQTPLCLRVFTTEGVYTFPAGNERYCFEGVVKHERT